MVAQVVGQRVDHDRAASARSPPSRGRPAARPSNARAKIGKSAFDPDRAVLSATGGIASRCPRARPRACRATFARTSSSSGSSSSSAISGSKKPSTITRTAAGRSRPARLHVEDRRLVELADGAAVRRRDVVGGDEHRGDRVDARLRREHHRVDLQVGVRLLGARVDLDQALEARAALAAWRRRASARRRRRGRSRAGRRRTRRGARAPR